MIPYQKFAAVYDRMEADHFSIRMAKYTRNILKKFGATPVDGLDLACGTGSAIRFFCENGIMMSGLDRSAPMLKIAAGKLRGHRVSLYCQSLPRFEIKNQAGGSRRSSVARYDLITSFYDSLNYLLSERDLKAAFRAVYRHLRDDGWFIFDMNTPHALRALWGATLNGGVKDDVAWLFRSEFDQAKITARLHCTFFVKDGRGWQRFDEMHTERAYPDQVIRALLRETGFQIKGYYRALSFEQAKAATNRICVVARRIK